MQNIMLALFFAACKHFTRLDAVAETKHGFNNQAFKTSCSNRASTFINTICTRCHPKSFYIVSRWCFFISPIWISYKVILSRWTNYLPRKLTYPSGHLKRKVVFQPPFLKGDMLSFLGSSPCWNLQLDIIHWRLRTSKYQGSGLRPRGVNLSMESSHPRKKGSWIFPAMPAKNSTKSPWLQYLKK